MNLSPEAITAISIIVGSFVLGGIGAYVFRPKKKKKD